MSDRNFIETLGGALRAAGWVEHGDAGPEIRIDRWAPDAAVAISTEPSREKDIPMTTDTITEDSSVRRGFVVELRNGTYYAGPHQERAVHPFREAMIFESPEAAEKHLAEHFPSIMFFYGGMIVTFEAAAAVAARGG